MKKKYLFLSFLFLTAFIFANTGQDNKEISMNVMPNKIENVAPLQKFTTIDFKQVFFASPLIYTALFFLSTTSLAIWLYSLLTFRTKKLYSKEFATNLKTLLLNQKYDEALKHCDAQKSLLSNMIVAGINSRRHGMQVMTDTIKTEGKRASASFWQKLSLLNDIVIIAPMFGLLGTVIGMFYAFYDVNRSIESINSLFDGLGIAVGTTVMGLIVAIIAMFFYTTSKYRLVKLLSTVENEAMSISHLIDVNN
jgi:biopolymer transport protein ExbB